MKKFMALLVICAALAGCAHFAAGPETSDDEFLQLFGWKETTAVAQTEAK